MQATGAQPQALAQAATQSPSSLAARYWQAALLATAVVILFWPVIVELVGDWFTQADYSHGFFVPLFSAYLIWRRRQDLEKIEAQPSWWGLAAVLCSLGLLFLGSLGAELFLARVGLVGTIVGLVWFFRGSQTVRTLAFPLAFLLLMIPLPTIIYNEIVFPMQLLASRFAGACLQQTHMFPILREGNLLILPNYTLEVVEACSGIRSLMSLLALSLAYGYLAETNKWIRLLLALLVFPIAIFSNGLRVMLAAAITYKYGPEIGEGVLHSAYGIIVFLVATFLIIAVHSGITRVLRGARASTGSAVA
jgi:exosortase